MTKSAQTSKFKKLGRIYIAKSFFYNQKEEEEFRKYWKRYSSRMIDAQAKSFIRKMGKFFSEIEKMGNDDSYVKDLTIKKVDPIKGHGVFALKKIPKKSIVTHYAGQVRKDEGGWGKNNRYVFGFTGTEKLKDWVLDAEKYCNLASFMNHSSEPNVEAVEYYETSGPKIVFQTLRDIEKGEELVYDYGDEYWKGLKEKPL